ncbi:MAG TPA: hypothetical protein VIR60_08785 [Gammaproteobacteria bacterium]
MNNPYASPNSNLIKEADWRRSKWLTGWLWFMLITTAISTPTTYLMADAIMQQSPKITMPLIYALIAISVVSMVSIIGLLRHKKLGFWGVSTVVAAAFIINLYGMGFKTALTGLIGFAILLFLLFKGGSNSAWSRLR